jgi:septum formation inhibitor-activating ATPase MinD
MSSPSVLSIPMLGTVQENKKILCIFNKYLPVEMAHYSTKNESLSATLQEL